MKYRIRPGSPVEVAGTILAVTGIWAVLWLMLLVGVAH